MESSVGDNQGIFPECALTDHAETIAKALETMWIVAGE